jgi:hypothetical protein
MYQVCDAAGALRLIVSFGQYSTGLWAASVLATQFEAKGSLIKTDTQFERVVLCLKNAVDVSRTLSPGYQLVMTICQ